MLLCVDILIRFNAILLFDSKHKSSKRYVFAAVVPGLYILEDTVIYSNYNNLLLLFIVYKTHIYFYYLRI